MVSWLSTTIHNDNSLYRGFIAHIKLNFFLSLSLYILVPLQKSWSSTSKFFWKWFSGCLTAVGRHNTPMMGFRLLTRSTRFVEFWRKANWVSTKTFARHEISPSRDKVWPVWVGGGDFKLSDVGLLVTAYGQSQDGPHAWLSTVWSGSVCLQCGIIDLAACKCVSRSVRRCKNLPGLPIPYNLELRAEKCRFILDYLIGGSDCPFHLQLLFELYVGSVYVIFCTKSRIFTNEARYTPTVSGEDKE